MAETHTSLSRSASLISLPSPAFVSQGKEDPHGVCLGPEAHPRSSGWQGMEEPRKETVLSGSPLSKQGRKRAWVSCSLVEEWVGQGGQSARAPEENFRGGWGGRGKEGVCTKTRKRWRAKQSKKETEPSCAVLGKWNRYNKALLSGWRKMQWGPIQLQYCSTEIMGKHVEITTPPPILGKQIHTCIFLIGSRMEASTKGTTATKQSSHHS